MIIEIIIFVVGFGIGSAVSFYMVYNFYKMKIVVQEMNYEKENKKLLEKINELAENLCQAKQLEK